MYLLTLLCRVLAAELEFIAMSFRQKKSSPWRLDEQRNPAELAPADGDVDKNKLDCGNESTARPKSIEAVFVAAGCWDCCIMKEAKQEPLVIDMAVVDEPLDDKEDNETSGYLLLVVPGVELVEAMVTAAEVGGRIAIVGDRVAMGGDMLTG